MLYWHGPTNRHYVGEEDRLSGTTYRPNTSGVQTYRTWGGQKLKLELNVDTIEPGTTPEEIMARDAERSEP